MNHITLRGCTPIPLAAYLKALAVLRLVAEQSGDRVATGWWRNDEFMLGTRLTKSELRTFFLERYQPTPVISPWSGRAGFLEGERAEQSTRKGAVAIRRVARSKGMRFSGYRQVIEKV
ncbi:MAG TPA: hypothetical protein VNL14_23295 [Candidatus Acidoferrales bacterium]|nr:hypothetical protein [Candidatus Acidoferrales bacterium]